MKPPAVDQIDLREVKVYEHLNVHSVIENQLEQQNDVGSFLVYDIGSIIDQYSSWESLLPNVLPSYVVGCNDDPVMLKTLARLGTRFCCSNKREVDGVLAAGVDLSRVTFFNPVKPASVIKYCAKIGLSTLAFDNEMELRKIKAQHPKAELVLQVAAGFESEQNEMEWMKGCPLKSVSSLLRAATSMGLTVTGVSAEVGGSGCIAGPLLERRVKLLREVYNMALSQDVRLKFIDLGNFTGDCSEQKSNFSADGRHLASLLMTEFPANLGVEVRGQVGDYLVGATVTLLTTVIAKRRLNHQLYTQDDLSPGLESEFCYYLNDGVYGTFSRVLADEKLRLSPGVFKTEDYANAALSRCTLMGPTCDDVDCVVGSCLLPELSVRDWLVFYSMGGVCSVPSIQSLASIYVIDKSHWTRLHYGEESMRACLCESDGFCCSLCSAQFTIDSSDPCDANNNNNRCGEHDSCDSSDSCDDRRGSCENSCGEDEWVDV